MCQNGLPGAVSSRLKPVCLALVPMNNVTTESFRIFAEYLRDGHFIMHAAQASLSHCKSFSSHEK